MTSEQPYPVEGQYYTRREVEEMAEAVLARWSGPPPEVGYIIGTGFAEFAGEIENAVTIPYEELPLFPRLNTPGHIEELVIGELEGRRVACARGKIFMFDGAPQQIVALPVRLFHTLGCRTLLYTNTVGSIPPEWKPGEFIVVVNHINLLGRNPLVGESAAEWGTQFFDMSYPYDAAYIEQLKRIASGNNIPLHEAVYASVMGPSFETAAEIRMLSIIGAHAVGMSTVPDVIAARQLGMRVACFGFISNIAAGVSEAPVENEDILGLASEHYDEYATLVRGILREM